MRRVLHDDGQEAFLEPRVMQALVALVRANGKILSRDDLLAQCWGGVIVGEDAISRVMARLRRVSEGPGAGVFRIETITKVGYRLIAETPVAPAAIPGVAAQAEPLLAVLAFDNFSGDPDFLYFSDGVSEEILHTVARRTGLKVVGRSSSFQLRGVDKSARRVAAELNATHVLDGSVRRSGDSIRVTAQLIECAGQTELWSDRFDRGLTEVFGLQDDIAAAVAAALKTMFAPATQTTRIDPAVYDLFLRAQGSQASIDPEKARRAIGMLEQVVAAAPRFGRAWGHLAVERAVALRRAAGGAASDSHARTAAVSAAETALKFDPRSASAYLALIWLEPFAAYDAREALIRKALVAAPNDPDVLSMMGWFCAQVGRCREALDYARQAYEVDPVSPQVAYAYAALIRDYNRSRDLWRTLYPRWPENDSIAYTALTVANHNGDWEWYDHLVSTLGSRLETPLLVGAMWVLRNLRNPDQRDIDRGYRILRKQLERTGTAPLGWISALHRLGRREESFEMVEQASFAHMFDETGQAPGDAHIAGRSSGGSDVIFRETNTMVSDPRFVRYCAKLGLCDYWIESGQWPDCADQVPYDFRSEAQKAAAEGLGRTRATDVAALSSRAERQRGKQGSRARSTGAFATSRIEARSGSG